MILYRITCSFDDVDGGCCFWAATKSDAKRIASYIERENCEGGDYEGSVITTPLVEKVVIPSHKDGLLQFLQSNASVEFIPNFPHQLTKDALA
jgi:hypothetical protein